MNLYPNLFSPIKIKGLNLSNRITMAPMYVGYADAEGKVTELVLDHYKKMGASGASLIVVENMCIDPSGLGAPFMLRVDKDEYIFNRYSFYSMLGGTEKIEKAFNAWQKSQ